MNIFPESSLAVSLITTVWVGLFVICFFNVRLGWTTSGLIVPGYLAPLLILKPWSAVAVIIEAVFTYLVVTGFSKFGEKTLLYSELFGRDRFFFILLISVAMRLLFDEVLFPYLTLILSQYFDIEFLFRDGLYSIGLVIVALTANQFWTSGLRRGLFQLVITLTITFLIIKYLLIGFTNFRLNEMANLYENLATSIVASPKAYIILLTAAFIATRMSLLYGWEFSGIAIPALLALLWYNPMEILISIVEAIIIYLIASFLLKTKFLSGMSIEGGRKILFFFNVAFFYKLALGFILPIFFTSIQPSDYYGFGYMLTSLIAIKMHEKGFAARIIGSTVLTSLISVAVATIVGFFLTFVTKNYHYDDALEALKKGDLISSKISINIPLKYKTGKPLALSSSPPGKIEAKFNNRKLNIPELKFIDEKILTPLIRLTEVKGYSASFLEKAFNEIAKNADIPGIKMTLFGNMAFRPDLVELKGSLESNSIATIFFNLSGKKHLILESDCLSSESIALARLIEDEFKPKVSLFNALFSRSYNGTIECETVSSYAKASLLSLCNQVCIRELDKSKNNLNIFLIKTSSKKIKHDNKTIYIATDTGAYSLDNLNKAQSELVKFITKKGYEIRFVSGSSETTDMETDNLLSSRYLDMTRNTSLMVLWVSR